MSSEVLLQATALSKIYTGTIHPIATLKQALFGIPVGAVDQFPVLDGINLTIKRGETVGLMGRNGAGKTTLLGILGNVIQPTTGTVERFGRISTLLGLTAGFNPNFTGRENAYLFCSIQGLTREEADNRMPSIEVFADLGRYFDLPLRTYSSGMQSRLAFSSAIYVDSDLIIIDETLAVGDANFRMKCYDRIRYMRDSGQTFLMVSHNQNLLANFCSRGIVLEGGLKVFDGSTLEAVEVYKKIRTTAMGDDALEGRIHNVKGGISLQGKSLPETVTLKDCKLHSIEKMMQIYGKLISHEDINDITINFGVSNSNGITVCSIDGLKSNFLIDKINKDESREIILSFKNHLLPGRYYISALIHQIVGDVTRPLSLYQNFLSFEISGQNHLAGIANLEMQINKLN